MSQAGIDSIQSWLSLELERRGIDAVIYTRHVLDLFLNSHFTTDLQLAKKEANIFARLPPGSKKTKPKQKYGKRSNSCTIDKIALKKQMAANCLRSASDDVSEDTTQNLTLLVENLYEKLNDCNLLSDTSSSSDEGCVGKSSEKRRESYQDAFPCLDETVDGENEANSNPTTSVWNGLKKFGDEGLHNIHLDLKSPEFELNSILTESPKEGNILKVKKDSVQKDQFVSRQPKTIEKSKKMGMSRHTVGKRRPHPFRDPTKKSPPSRYKRKNANAGPHHSKEKMDFDKENSADYKPRHTRKADRPKRRPGTKSLQQVSNFPKNFNLSFGENALTNVKSSSPKTPTFKSRYTTTPAFQQLLSHCLPARGWNGGWCDAEETYLPTAAAQGASRPISSSKWFLDPESGCLEFEPAQKSKSSATTSPSSVESWLFCPSPSLWDNDDQALPDPAQSRLERLYKPSAILEGKKSNTNPVWEGLKSITISDRKSAFSEFSPDKIVGHKKTVNSRKENDLPDCPLCLIDSTPVTHDLYHSAIPLCGSGMFEGCFPSQRRTNTHMAEQHSFLADHWIPSAEATSSRKEIWLKNSNQLSTANELDKMLFWSPSACHTAAWSPWSAWSSDTEQFAFNNYANSGPWDGLFNDVTYTLVEAAKFQFFVDLGLPVSITDDAKKKHNRLPAMPALSASRESPPVIEQQRRDYDEDLHDMTAVLQGIFDLFSYTEEQFDDLKVNLGVVDAAPDEVFPWPHSDLVAFDGKSSLQPDQSEALPLSSRSEPDSTCSSSSYFAEWMSESHAWKTSLRMTNTRPSISSIRPVNVLYSEKCAEADAVTLLQPTSCTHFRPIHDAELDISEISIDSSLQDGVISEPIEIAPLSEDYCEYSFSSSPKKPFKKCNGCPACDSKLRGIEQEIGKILFDGSPVAAPQSQCMRFRPKFRKIKEDKSMQTTFEEKMRSIDSDMYRSFSLRPPKANSR